MIANISVADFIRVKNCFFKTPDMYTLELYSVDHMLCDEINHFILCKHHLEVYVKEIVVSVYDRDKSRLENFFHNYYVDNTILDLSLKDIESFIVWTKDRPDDYRIDLGRDM